MISHSSFSPHSKAPHWERPASQVQCCVQSGSVHAPPDCQKSATKIKGQLRNRKGFTAAYTSVAARQMEQLEFTINGVLIGLKGGKVTCILATPALDVKLTGIYTPLSRVQPHCDGSTQFPRSSTRPSSHRHVSWQVALQDNVLAAEEQVAGQPLKQGSYTVLVGQSNAVQN